MYRVVQTTGPDGKNLLKLLPISKSSASFVPIVQSSAMPNNSKANISNPVHLTFKTQLPNTTTPSSVKIPVFQSANPGKIILTRTIDKQESVKASSEKESLTTKSAANVQSSCVSVDRLSLQNIAVTSSSNQTNTAYMLVNTKSLPVSVKTPGLPSGHHLQIPADAEVKSVPASSLPPVIQQKILAAAATNVSGGADSTKMPTVIYVSPVNTVKTVLPKRLQTICPKPSPEVSKPLLMTTTQKASSSHPETVASDGQQCQQVPVKWIVQSCSQSSAPCLIPVKSSNNVASKILKTLADMKNVELNSANILPLCSSSPGGSQTKITSVKDNALVMYNGKVYLLTKRGSDVLTAQADKQALSSDVSLGKEMPKIMDSNAVTKITSKVVNLVLSKNKGVVLSQKDPKPCLNLQDASSTDLRKDLKSTPAVPVTLNINQQNSTVNQDKSLPVTQSISGGVTPITEVGTLNINQQNSTVNQDKSLPVTQSISGGVTPITEVGTQKNVCQNGKEKSPSPKAATCALPHSKQKSAFSEECQQIQFEKMDSPGKVIQIKHQEKPHWKKYMELRKKFGLSKEERVYLRRIPLRTSCEISEEGMCSSNSSKRRNDSSSSSSLDLEIISQPQACVEQQKVIVDLEEDLSRKRKLKSSPLSDTGKRRKTSVRSTTSTSPDHSSPSSVVLNKSVSPPPILVQQSISTGSAISPLGRESEQDPCSQNSDITDSSIPILVSCEDDASVIEGSFKDDTFPLTPPDLDETIRDEKIKRLKQLLREREAALEEMRRKMQQT